MKKLIAMGLTVIMTAVAVCGCGSSDSGNDAKKSDSQTKQQAVKVIDVDLTSEEYAFGVDKNKPELLTQVNDFIKEIKDNGTFDEICNKYFGGGNPTPVKSEKLDTSKDQLLVATNASFEPFEYMKGDSYYGIDMEIAAALAKKLNKELVIQNMEFDSVCLSVGQHKSDVAMAGLTVKEDKSVTIGVQNGTTGQFYCEGDKDWGFEGYKVTTTGYKNGSLAVQDLINGNINYVVIDSAPAKCITEAINKMQ